jgi:hypothetical protein
MTGTMSRRSWARRARELGVAALLGAALPWLGALPSLAQDDEATEERQDDLETRLEAARARLDDARARSRSSALRSPARRHAMSSCSGRTASAACSACRSPRAISTGTGVWA